MSEKWEGFSPEEILNITNQKCLVSKDFSQSNNPVKKTAFKQNKYGKKNMTRDRMLKTCNKNQLQTDGKQLDHILPQEARLFIPQIPEEDELEDEQSKPEISSPLQKPSEPSLQVESSTAMNTEYHTSSEVSLDDFEKKQKMIKEQNRQRKELLKKALDDRTKRTQEEARRLGQIEEELKKLDVQLSNDVSILRNQIEVASLEFMEAQKRFDRAEREYLDAKLALFTKKERKELLTGHLCTIIEQNELRKAKKLSDLMDKLQLGSVIIEKPMKLSLSDNIKADSSTKNKDQGPMLETVEEPT